MVLLSRIRRVAEDLEVSERTVQTWISEGILRCYHVGRLVFLDPEEVTEDIKAYSAANPSVTSAEEEPGEVPDEG